MINRALLFLLISLSACKKDPVAPPPPIPTPTPEVKEVTERDDAVEEMKANFQRVYFDFDASSINTDSKQALSANATIMSRFPGIKIEVQGHADERGTTDYNLALGQKRANAVERYLIGEGVAPSRIRTVSYGEERPIDSSESEYAFSKNRRAEFRVLTSNAANVEGTIND